MLDVLFIVPNEELKISRESNGTMLLGTILLQNGFNVDILRFGQINTSDNYSVFINAITEEIIERNPRSVSFYTLWPHYHTILRIASILKDKKPEIITILGGPQSSATAADTMASMPFIDYICTGEGENTVLPFFVSVLHKNGKDLDTVPGLYYRSNGEICFNSIDIPFCDLNTLPRWDDRLYLKEYNETTEQRMSSIYYMPIDAGRGCPYSCTFCCTSHFWRRAYRLKSPERIVEDIRYYHDKFGIKSFWFSHDAFTSNKALVSAVCDRIIEDGLDINWKCTARVDCLTEELIDKMILAGMDLIELGIETGSPRMQKLVNKNLNLEKSKKTIAHLLNKKLFVGLFFMYGFPEETEQDLNETLELLFDMIDMGVNHTSMSFCRFNPTTDITNRYIDRLTLDPKIKTLSRRIFGYAEELQMIKDNKALFPYFYHLDTPVRNTYQYLLYFEYLYRCFPHTIKFIRNLYHGDNLRFYKDFYEQNIECFSDIKTLTDNLKKNPLKMICNTLDGLSCVNRPQAKAMLKFENDIQRVFRSDTDAELIEEYDFNYHDYRMKLPIEQYTEGKTTLLIQRKNGIFDVKIVKIS